MISELYAKTQEYFDEAAEYFQSLSEDQKETEAYQEARDEAIIYQTVKYNLEDIESALKYFSYKMIPAILHNERGRETAFWRRKELFVYETEEGERELPTDRFLEGLKEGFTQEWDKL